MPEGLIPQTAFGDPIKSKPSVWENSLKIMEFQKSLAKPDDFMDSEWIPILRNKENILFCMCFQCSNARKHCLSGDVVSRTPLPPLLRGVKNIVLASLRREVARSAGGFYHLD